MDTVPAPDLQTDNADLERERAEIARARASVEAGWFATAAEVRGWIESLGTNRPLPLPSPKAPRAR